MFGLSVYCDSSILLLIYIYAICVLVFWITTSRHHVLRYYYFQRHHVIEYSYFHLAMALSDYYAIFSFFFIGLANKIETPSKSDGGKISSRPTVFSVCVWQVRRTEERVHQQPSNTFMRPVQRKGPERTLSGFCFTVGNIFLHVNCVFLIGALHFLY